MMWTPWGLSDHVEQIAPGIQFVSTPGHGGFKVSADRLKAMPMAWLEASFGGQGKRGWFEEDCDYCLVILAFPECFEPRKVEHAKETFAYWIEPKIAKVEG